MAKKKEAQTPLSDEAKAVEEKRKTVLSIWSNHDKKEPVQLHDLPLDVIVLVMGMMSLGTDDNNDSITPLKKYLESLYPSSEGISQLLNKAFDEDAIILDVGRCRVSDFTDDGKNFYIYEVNYLPNITWADNIPIETVRSPKKALEHIHSLFLKGCWYEEWTDQLLDLWEKIALMECLQYANNRAATYNFHQDAVNLDEICKGLLKTFSVSKIHSMISSAFHNAAAFQKTAECTSYRHALNTIPGKISSIASKQGSQVKEWDRIHQLPRCELSLTLFNKVLGFNEDIGFYSCPSTKYSAIAQKRLDTFVDPRGDFDKNKIAVSHVAHTMTDYLYMLLERHSVLGLDSTGALLVRAKVEAFLFLWTGLSEIPLKDAPPLVEALGELARLFEKNGFEFIPLNEWME